jgi:hypothetical protein
MLGNAYHTVPLTIKLSKTESVQVCPGYLVRLPAVVEAAKAHAAFRVGELSTVFPNPGNAVVEGALEVGASFSAYDSAMIRAARDQR